MVSTLQTLVAHYLALNYPSVLPAFLAAAQIPSPDPAHPPHPDLRTLVSDYVSDQLAQQASAMDISQDDNDALRAIDGSWRGWKLRDMMGVPMAENTRLSGVTRSIEGISASNLISVGVEKVPRRVFQTSTAAYHATASLSILTTSVDKTLKIIDYSSGEVESVLQPHRAAILSFALHPVNPRYLLTSSMDGSTILTDLITSTTLQTFPSKKFVVRAAFSPNGQYFATASYDHHVVIYRALTPFVPPPLDDDDLPLDDSDDPLSACEPDLRYEEVKRIKGESNPEAMVWHPASTWLMYTLRSSHLLHYVHVETWETQTKSFNPHPMDTHISFSVLNLALHPSGKILACQTGDQRGGAGERILLYGIEPEETERLACLWTGTDSDDFVLPRMTWLPDGSGLITTTPNGYLNLIAISGETRSSVKIHGAQDLGQASSEVVRDCCIVATEDGWEVVSVGYDRQIRISR